MQGSLNKVQEKSTLYKKKGKRALEIHATNIRSYRDVISAKVSRERKEKDIHVKQEKDNALGDQVRSSL